VTEKMLIARLATEAADLNAFAERLPIGCLLSFLGSACHASISPRESEIALELLRSSITKFT
jgi:hypothetical protein